MTWGDNGITNKRIILDQSPSFTWGGTFLRLNTKALSQVGYLSRLRLQFPHAGGLLTRGGAAAVAAQAAAQLPAARAIQSLDITAQGIAQLYQLGRGTDLVFLEYVRNGLRESKKSFLGNVSQAAGVAVASLGRTAPNTQNYGEWVAAGADNATPSVGIKLDFDLPLTEWVKFPASVVQGPNGPVAVAAQEVEVGILTLQNTQQNITPHVVMNPLYSTGIGAPFTASTVPTGSINALLNLYSEFYDVPEAPGDQPPAYSRMFVITRQSTDDPVSGGAVNHNFQAAGLLMRAIYTFEDTNGLLVDVSNQALPTLGAGSFTAGGAEGSIQFQWGATVIKSTELFTQNLTRAAERYGEPPPLGCLVHDFFEDRSTTDMINTAKLTAVRTSVTGLPTSVTNMHTIEERMIPVRLA